MRTIALREVSSLITKGTTPKTLGLSYSTTGVPFLRGEDVKGQAVDPLSVTHHITNEVHETLKRSQIKPGDLLITIAGTVGRVGFVGQGSPSMNCNQAVAIIRIDQDRLLPEFACFACQAPLVLGDISRQGTTATITNLSLEQIGSLQIPLPPIEEQRQIVDILYRAASIERLRRQASAHLRDFIPALYFKMFGDPVENPMGWLIEELGSLTVDGARNGLSPSRTGSVRGEVLTLSAITRGAFDPNALKEGTFDHAIPDDQTVKTSRFLLCRGNGNPDLVGRGHFPTRDMPGVAFPDTIIALEFQPNRLKPEFVEALWATRYMRDQIERAAKTTNGTYKINQGSLLGFSIPVPPLEMQETFAKLARTAQARASLAISADNLASKLSASLLSNLLEHDRS